METLSKAEIIRRIIEDVESELKDEDLLQLVLERTISQDHGGHDQLDEVRLMVKQLQAAEQGKEP